MSSYLTFNLNGIDILTVSRASYLYMACENAPYENAKEVTEFDLVEVVQDANKYAEELNKRKNVLELVLERASLDRDEIEGVVEEIEDIGKDIEGVNSAISIIKVLIMMLEENFYKDDEEKIVLKWVKD